MNSINIDEVLEVFNYYRSAMISVGINIKLPQNTEITKTYAYRSIVKFIEKMKEWGLTSDVYGGLIKHIVLYAKKKQLLNKGIMILQMESTLQICHDYLKSEIDKNSALLYEVRKSKEFLTNNTPKVLLHKQNKKGYSNIIKWLKSGDLSVNYIAISKACRQAINNLDDIDRDMLPSDFKLLKSRIKILSDKEIRNKLMEIMGSDLWISGTSIF